MSEPKFGDNGSVSTAGRSPAEQKDRHRSVIPRQAMPEAACAFCGSSATEPLSIYGCHMMTAQYYCRSCRSTFDSVRDEWAAGS